MAQPIKDFTGQRKNSLQVIKLSHVNNHGDRVWDVRCDCGKTIKIATSKWNSRTGRSCGCEKIDKAGEFHWRGVGDRKNNGLGISYWNELKKNAKKRGIKFTISIQQAYDIFLKQNSLCALSGVPLLFRPSGGNRNLKTASLDRIDSSKHYEIDNVQWIHKDINRMKNNLSEKIFLDWISKIWHNKNI